MSIDERRASGDSYGFYEGGAITVVRSAATFDDVLAAFGATAHTDEPSQLEDAIEKLHANDYDVGQVFERNDALVIVELNSYSAVRDLQGLSRGGVAVALWLDEAVDGSRITIARDGDVVREFQPAMYAPADSDDDDGEPLDEEAGLPWPLLTDGKDDDREEDDAAYEAQHLTAVWSSLELVERLTGVHLADGTDIFSTPRICYRLRPEA